MLVKSENLIGHDTWVRSLEIAYGVPAGYFEEGYRYLLGYVEVFGARGAMLNLVHRMHNKRSTISPLSILEIASYSLDVLVSRGFYVVEQDQCIPVLMEDFVRLVDIVLLAGEKAENKSPEELCGLPPFLVRCTQCGTEVELPELYELTGERIEVAGCARCRKTERVANGE